MKITCLAENTAYVPDIRAEHGLSLFIETGKYKILFDMGQTELFYENACKLGINLSTVDFAILSHGHYDHGGGLKKFLEINSKAPVYINKYAFEPHYNGTEKYIGLDLSLKDSSRLVFTDDTFSISDGFELYTCNSEKKKFSLGSFGLNMKTDEAFEPDDFRHEHYLLIKENGRKILISGCSHKGIPDITAWFSPDVLIGGFHFSKLPLDVQLAEYARFLDNFPTEYYTCHCTGIEQYEFMKKYMKDLHYLSCGESIEL